MKKLVLKLAALMCVAMLFLSLVACNERVKINEALENTSKLETLDCDLYWKVSIKEGAQKKSVSIKEKILIDKDKIHITASEYGSDEKSIIYADGEYVYLSDGQKISKEEYESKNVSLDNNVRGLLTTYPKQFYEVARVDNINGKLKLSVSLESRQLRAVLDTFLTGMEKQLDMEGGDGITIEYSDNNLEIFVVDGYVTQVNLSFAVERKGDDVTKEARISLSLNINEPSEIQPCKEGK